MHEREREGLSMMYACWELRFVLFLPFSRSLLLILPFYPLASCSSSPHRTWHVQREAADETPMG
jgi:hypothetical protein